MLDVELDVDVDTASAPIDCGVPETSTGARYLTLRATNVQAFSLVTLSILKPEPSFKISTPYRTREAFCPYSLAN